MKFVCNIELGRMSGGTEPARNIINHIGNSFYSAANTLYVSSNYSNYPTPYYSTIQAAINAASSGDTIIVYAGSYDERVSINKNLNIYAFAGAKIAPTADRSDAIVTIGSAIGANPIVNIDGQLEIFYNQGTYQPAMLSIAEAIVNIRMYALTGASNFPLKVDHADAEVSIRMVKNDISNDLNISSAKYFYLEAEETHGIRLQSGVTEAIIHVSRDTGNIHSSATECNLYNCQGSIFQVSAGKMILHHCSSSNEVNATGGQLIAFDSVFEGDESVNGIINIDHGACHLKLFNSRIKNFDAGTGSTCINTTGAFATYPIIIKDCVLIHGNTGSTVINGTGANVYNHGSIANTSVAVGGGIVVNVEVPIETNPLVSDF